MPSILTGATPGTGAGPYGGVPQVPDPFESLRTALGGNMGSLSSLLGLTTGTSGISASGARTQLEQNLPGYAPMMDTASNNILANLHGQVSPDVIHLLAQNAAQRGVGFGPSSPNSNAAFLQALGRTSMDLQNLGQTQLTGAIGRTPTGPAFNPASFLISPGEVQSSQQYANLLRSAPDPAAAAQEQMAQLNRGIGVGAGAVPAVSSGARGALDALGFPITPDLGYGPGGPPQVIAPSLGTGTTYGGELLPAGSTPGSVSSDWTSWYNQTFGGGRGTTPSGADDWMSSFWNDWDTAGATTGGGDVFSLGGYLGSDSGPADMGGYDPGYGTGFEDLFGDGF